MPKAIDDIDGYKFYFYSKEGNEPPHIHVKKAGGEAKFWLTPDVILEYHFNFIVQELKKAVKLVFDNKDTLINQWNDYFNRYTD